MIRKAEGSYLYDSEGVRLLDAFAGLWCVNVGYGRDEIVERLGAAAPHDALRLGRARGA